MVNNVFQQPMERYGSLRIEKVWQISEKNFRVWDSDEKEPHLLAEVWYSDFEDSFVIKQIWEPHLRPDEMLQIVSFAMYKNNSFKK